MNPVWRIPLLLLALSHAFPVLADTETEVRGLLPLSLEELLDTKVSISTNTQQTLSKAPSVVSVITAEDIKATGATNLVDVLQGVPGVYIRSNLFGLRPLITFRGASSTHTLLMINGAPVKDLVWASGIFWKGLPIHMIERVEIIRGPGSALFGSDASSGVINVITKTAGKIAEDEAGIRVGSFDSQSAWLQHGSTWNGIDVALTAEVSHTGGHDPAIPRDAQTIQDGRVGTSASLAPGNANYGWEGRDVHLSLAQGNWRLLADHSAHDNVGIGLTGAAVLDPKTQGNDQQNSLALLYNNATFGQNWALSAELRHRDLEYSSGDGFWERPPGYSDTTGSYPEGYRNLMRSAERRTNAEVSGLFTGVRYHALRIGAGYVAQDLYRVEQYINKGTGPTGTTLPAGGPLVDVSGTAYAFAPEMTRRNSYLFVQDTWTIAEDLELTAGARHDHYSDFGGTTNPRFALVWQASSALSAKLMYGQAFRAPSFLELYSLTSATKPNRNLAPEESKTWDLSFSYAATRRLVFGLDFYHFVQTNVIGADATNRYQNIGNLMANGVELEARWQATDNLRLVGNLSDRHEQYSPLRSFDVPKQQGYLRMDWAVAPRWNWNVQANWVGGHLHPVGDPRKPIGAYTLMDTTLRYVPNRQWEVAASIRNLFDVDAREISSRSLPENLPLPGRNLYAEVIYRF
jgi:iron complex outermembrane receptor protein